MPADPAAASGGLSNLPAEQMTARGIDACADCGHPKALHYGLGFQNAGFRACMGMRDLRGPGTGGDTLTPCDCKGWRNA